MLNKITIACLSLVAAHATPAWPAAPASKGTGQEKTSQMFCCREGGRQICGDTVPQPCYGKPYKVFNEKGLLIKEVSGAMTPEERAKKQAEEKRKKDEELAKKEQSRKDAALLATYSSENDVEEARKKSEIDLKKLIAEAEQKLAESKKKYSKLEEELEFYRNKPVPENVRSSLVAGRKEVELSQQVVDMRKSDLEAAMTRFSNEKERLKALRSPSR